MKMFEIVHSRGASRSIGSHSQELLLGSSRAASNLWMSTSGQLWQQGNDGGCQFEVSSSVDAHRAACLGFDYRLDNEEEEEAQMSASARATVGDVDISASETGGKYTVDVFGQSHPTVAQDMFDCMNCGRPIVAGRFAPHLEKCMGKGRGLSTVPGRKARLKANSSVAGLQPRRSRASTPVASTANNTANHRSSRPVARTPASIPEDLYGVGLEINGAVTFGETPEDEKDLLPGPPHPIKARSKKSATKIQRTNPGALVAAPPFGGVVGTGASSPDTALGSQSGLVSGMAVPIAVETDPVSANHKHGGVSNVRTGTMKGRKSNEKKRNMGQVLAGGASITNGRSGEVEARRTVEVRVENSNTAAMLPFRDPAWS